MLACALIASVVLAAPPEREAAEHDNAVVLAFGPSFEVDSNGSGHVGAEAEVEFDLVQKWLELEVGIQGLAGAGSEELSADILLKKPFDVTHGFSFMPGIGPEVVVGHQSGRITQSFGLEIAVDFMWWVFSERFGIGAEPAVGMTFAPFQASVGLTIGPIIGW